MSDFPFDLPRETLTNALSEWRTTQQVIASIGDEVTARAGMLSKLYEELTTKPAVAALIYRDSISNTLRWQAIGQRLVVGRSVEAKSDVPSMLVIDGDPTMGRRHFEVVLTESGKYVVSDLQSRNGTKLNGEKVTTAKLITGSQIVAGTTLFVFADRLSEATEA